MAPVIAADTAATGRRVLSTAVADCLEAALDQAARAATAESLERVAALCRDVIVLTQVAGVIERRARPSA